MAQPCRRARDVAPGTFPVLSERHPQAVPLGLWVWKHPRLRSFPWGRGRCPGAPSTPAPWALHGQFLCLCRAVGLRPADDSTKCRVARGTKAGQERRPQAQQQAQRCGNSSCTWAPSSTVKNGTRRDKRLDVLVLLLHPQGETTWAPGRWCRAAQLGDADPPRTSYQERKGSSSPRSGCACVREAAWARQGAETEVLGVSVLGSRGLTWEVRMCRWP